MRRLATCAAALLLSVALAPASHAQDQSGQPMRAVGALPSDCLQFLPPGATGGLMDWKALVWVEHCDRIKRLQRISSALPPNERPQFYDGTILARELPGYVGIDVPVLRVVFPDRSFFATNESVVKPGAFSVARIVAESLRKEPPDVVMFVAGHADARASRTYNEALSIDRSNALAAAILQFGTGDASVWRVGFGEDLPLVAGASEAAYDKNRRIEFLFSARSEALGVWMARNQKDDLCQGRTRSEIDRCKQALTFQPTYEVVELVPATRTRAEPRRGRSRSTGSDRGERRSSRSSAGSRAAVTTSAQSSSAVETSRGGSTQLNLSRGRKIALDLTRGKSN